MELIITSDKNPAPVARGGTELMVERVRAIIPADLQEKVQLVVSQKPAVLEDKPRILWLHDLPTQPGPDSALAGDGHEDYNAIVFVSYWQREQFTTTYPQIPLEKCLVIKNGIQPFYNASDIEQVFVPKALTNGGPFKLLYTSTPHRGLELVPKIVDGIIQAGITNFEFHVYSSFVLYGQPQNDVRFRPLFDTLDAHSHIRNHGTVDNETIREACRGAHLFVYPCVYPETSCLAAIEAMAAGCVAIVPGIAALPETCGEWAFTYPWIPRAVRLVDHTVDYVVKIINAWPTNTMQMHLLMQTSYMNNFFNIARRAGPWTSLFDIVSREPVPEPPL